jgi:putative Mn2+ efflux pump MntP
MLKALMLACVLSMDTLIVSIVLSTLGLARPVKRNLVLLFSFCDGAASLAAWFVRAFWLRDFDPVFGRLEMVALCLYAALVIALGWSKRDAILLWQPSGRLFYGLPFLLSLDNLVTGLSFDNRNIPLSLFVVSIGLVSGLMSILGLWIGSVVRRYSSIPVARCAAAGPLRILAAMSLR